MSRWADGFPQTTVSQRLKPMPFLRDVCTGSDADACECIVNLSVKVKVKVGVSLSRKG